MNEKMSPKEAAIVRSKLYEITLNALVNDGGFDTEAVSDGALVHLGDGQFAKIRISVCDATKFDLNKIREEYKEKLAKQAEAAEKKAEAARAKAEKEARKAEKNKKEVKE